jgi:hypothetical protein
MRPLREVQRRFAEALLSDDAPAAFIDAGGVDVAQRVAIYRNNIFSNYRNALGASYPVVCRIVGKAFFDAAVDAFVRECPSTAGDLNGYGGDFASFLVRYPHAKELAYLPDVARLEWAIDEAQRAADHDGSPSHVTGALAAIAPEALPGVVLALDASCRLVASEFPVLRIWRVNQPDYAGDMRVDLDAGADRLLVRREGGIVAITRIDEATFAWLATLARGQSLGSALDAACAADSEFDLATAFNAFIGDGTIAHVAKHAVR